VACSNNAKQAKVTLSLNLYIDFDQPAGTKAAAAAKMIWGMAQPKNRPQFELASAAMVSC